MVIYTKARILPLNSTKIPTPAAIEIACVFGVEESREAASARAPEDTRLREWARFNLVFDYPKGKRARSLYSGCTFHKGNWLLRLTGTNTAADDLG